MKVSRAIKKIVALGIGATMMGATILGATAAADLKDYPKFFLDDGTYDGVIVLSGSADSLAGIDISSNMFYQPVTTGNTTTAQGDAWQVKTVSDYLEFNESIGPAASVSGSTSGVVDFIDSDELDSLADGKITNEKGTFVYEQFLHFNNLRARAVYEENDEDVTALFFKIPDSTNIGRYELEFTEPVETDIDASESFEMDDLEGRDVKMFGVSYNIVQARHGGTSNSAQVKLVLMGGSVRDTIRLEESKTFTLDGKTYDVQLVFVDATNVKFVVNGESTRLLNDGETHRLSDSTTIGVSEILYQDYAGGIQSVEFFLGANKLELKDTNITNETYGESLKVDEETIDEASVRITGTMLTRPTASADGELEISTLEVNMTAEDDFWIPINGKLSTDPNMVEKGVLFTTNWDYEFKGLSTDPRTTFKLTAKRSEEEYWVTFTNTQGNVIEFPLAYGGTAGQVRFGERDHLLALNKSDVKKDEYFILNDDTDEDSITHLVQYRGSDKSTATNPKMKFKIIGTGETLERSYDATARTATLKLAGTTYTFTNSTLDTADDYGVNVISGHAATYFAGERGGANVSDVIFAQYGMQVGFWGSGDQYNSSGATNATGIIVNVTAFDTDTFDDNLGTVRETIIQFNITPDGTEVDLTRLNATKNPTLTSPDDNDDHSFGYSRYGAYIDLYSPTGSGTSADELTITYPSKQSEVLVFVTTKGTTFGTGPGGNMARVTIPVTATKLPDEVTDVKAQNIITVGGPCANSVTADVMYTQQGKTVPDDCTTGFTAGEAIIALYDVGDKVAMVAAGYSGDDTRRAGKVLAQASRYGLSGKQVTVTGTTFEDISVTKVS